MQDQIPIFTLEQDWLWCQTWCSDESLATAKTSEPIGDLRSQANLFVQSIYVKILSQSVFKVNSVTSLIMHHRRKSPSWLELDKYQNGMYTTRKLRRLRLAYPARAKH